MKFSIKALLLLCAPFMYQAQNVQQDFIVVHVEPSGKAQFKQKIFAYHFLNGSFTGRDEVLTVDGKRDGKDYIRTDRGHNTLYKDRYLITGIGNIIDLKDKKVLFDGKANLVRCSNDSAIFYTNDAFKGKFYSVYNFKTSQYGEVKDLLFKAKLGRDVEFDKTTAPFKIVYYPQGKPKVVLTEDAGYGQIGTKDNFVPDPLMLWFDNTNFLYANFNRENTEISFYKINVDSKASTLVGKAAIAKDEKAADLVKLTPRQVIMTIGAKQLYIDLDNQSVTELLASKPVNGFSYEFKDSPLGRMVKLNGKETGKFHFEPNTFSAGNNIAGFVKELVIGTDHYQQGFMVWNAPRQTWDKVDADEALTIIGWINN
jgi:hypothetical protein